MTSSDPYYDFVTCGDGNDTFYPDLSESSVIAPQDSCENVVMPPPESSPTGPTTTTQPPPPSVPRVSKPKTALKLKKGVVAVTVDCLVSGGDCIGELRLLSGKTIVGKGKFSLDNGDKKKAVKVKLSSAGKKLAKKKKSLKLKLVAVIDGKQTTLTTLTVRTR